MPRHRSPARPAIVASVTVAALAIGVTGCAQFDAAFGKQWVQVTFASGTSVATARHITSVCSHIPNLKLEGPVRSDTAQRGVVDTVNYTATKASDAQLSLLEQCLGKFPTSVIGVTEMDQGDTG